MAKCNLGEVKLKTMMASSFVTTGHVFLRAAWLVTGLQDFTGLMFLRFIVQFCMFTTTKHPTSSILNEFKCRESVCSWKGRGVAQLKFRCGVAARLSNVYPVFGKHVNS